MKSYLSITVGYGIIIFGCEIFTVSCKKDAGVAEWQTHQTQNLALARVYEFKSRHRHKIS